MCCELMKCYFEGNGKKNKKMSVLKTKTETSATALTLGSIENEFCPTHRNNWRQVLRVGGEKKKK